MDWSVSPRTLQSPGLLFQAISRLDVAQNLNFPLLVSYFGGATSGFLAAMLGARLIFKREWADSVAFGFLGLYGNSVLLGLPISERAYGTDSLQSNFAIIAFHAPFCYGVGTTFMEFSRNRGQNLGPTIRKILTAMFRNALVLSIAMGFAWNFSGLQMPSVIDDALGMMARASLPVALFSLGGVLYFYRPEGDYRAIAFVCAVSLILHPATTMLLGLSFGLSQEALRASVTTASMAPGVNAYLFASFYGVARRVAASAVLVATAMSIFTVWVWLLILP